MGTGIEPDRNKTETTQSLCVEEKDHKIDALENEALALWQVPTFVLLLMPRVGPVSVVFTAHLITTTTCTIINSCRWHAGLYYCLPLCASSRYGWFWSQR